MADDGPRCGLILFLHLEKTGGTWIRHTVRRSGGLQPCRRGAACNFSLASWQSVEDPCLLQEVLRTHWQPILQMETADNWRLRTVAQRKVTCWSPPAVRHPNASAGYVLPPLDNSRFFVEFHSHNWNHWDAIASVLPDARHLYAQSRCSFTVFTVLREPRQQQLSHWNFFGRPLGRSLERSAGLSADLSLKSILGAGGSGPNWAREHGEPIVSRNVTSRDHCAEVHLVRKALERLATMDVVGQFESMDAALSRVAALSGYGGFPPFGRSRGRSAHLPYNVTSLTPNPGEGVVVTDSSADALAAVSPAAIRVLTAAAACDSLLYEYARERGAAEFLTSALPQSVARASARFPMTWA